MITPLHFWVGVGIWVVIEALIICWLVFLYKRERRETVFSPEQIQMESDWSEMIDDLNRKGFTSRPPLPDDSDQEAFHLDAPQPPRAA